MSSVHLYRWRDYDRSHARKTCLRFWFNMVRKEAVSPMSDGRSSYSPASRADALIGRVAHVNFKRARKVRCGICITTRSLSRGSCHPCRPPLRIKFISGIPAVGHPRRQPDDARHRSGNGVKTSDSGIKLWIVVQHTYVRV